MTRAGNTALIPYGRPAREKLTKRSTEVRSVILKAMLRHSGNIRNIRLEMEINQMRRLLHYTICFYHMYMILLYWMRPFVWSSLRKTGRSFLFCIVIKMKSLNMAMRIKREPLILRTGNIVSVNRI